MQRNPDRYSIVQQLAASLITLATMMPTILQPLLLGALLREHRIDAVQLGQAATAEQLGMAFTAFCAGAWLRPVNLRPILLATLSLCAAANLATSFLAGQQIILARLVSGLASGTAIWLIISMVARAEWPARFMGLYVLSQSLIALLLSAMLSLVLLPALGATGGFQAIAAFVMLAMVCLPIIPSRLSELPTSSHGWMPTATGILGLIVVGLYMGAGLAIWIYVLPLAAASGIAPTIANATVSVGIAAQMLGGLAAIYIRGLAAPKILVACVAVELAASATLTLTSVSPLFMGAGFLFCFGLTLGVSFLIPFLEVVDPSRRAGALCGSAQLLGQSFGAYCASSVVARQGVHGAGYTGIALLVLVLTTVFISITLTTHRYRPRFSA